MRTRTKISFLIGLVLLYLVIGGFLFVLGQNGSLTNLVEKPRVYQIMDNDFTGIEKNASIALEAAKDFVDWNLKRENGHIDLYSVVSGSAEESYGFTNSEAVSYYLLWNAQDYNKVAFDEELDFIEENMKHRRGGFLMWKLDSNDEVIDDGANIASDADLRAIRALYLAKETWGDDRYQEMIDELSFALENIAVSEDYHFTPYGGFRDGEVWKTDEAWLSYSDFNAFAFMANDDKVVWREVYHKMKESNLEAQDENGLYFTQVEENGDYSSRLDNGGYSINTLWIMVSNAESTDEDLQDSARTALEFYKDKYEEDGMIFTDYNKNGSRGSGGDSPWVYALVGRAAILLKDEEFSDSMIMELLKKQDLDENSETYGAFLEGGPEDRRAGQFTIQESILTLQEYVAFKSSKRTIFL